MKASKTKKLSVTPTSLNVWVLSQRLREDGTLPSRVEQVDFPHLRRCLAGGLIEADSEGVIRITDKGREAVAREIERGC